MITPSQPIPVISLFTGAGGLDLGFREGGFKTVIALDADRAAVETYNANKLERCATQCNLRRIDGQNLVALIGQHAAGVRPRGVIGGPPCQTFSIGNVRRSRTDGRGTLGLHYARLVGALNRGFNLDFFVFENVTGLRNPRHRTRYKNIISALTNSGFAVFAGELDAVWFGVPQNRQRLFLVGINALRYPWLKFEFPSQPLGKPHTVRDAIKGLPEPTFFKRGIMADQIPFHPNHWTMNPRSKKFSARNAAANGDGRSFRRLKWDRPSRTVAYGNREIHLHPSGHRRLSVLEAMLLQGFRVDFELKGTLSDQISQVSNAVPPPLAAALARSLYAQLYGRIDTLHQELLAWFKTHRRRFPWRKTSDPFKVLIAEKLLQQTAATRTVVKAYQTLVKTFPNCESLAKASIARITRIIRPLGLHYRAAEIIELARVIRDNYHRQVPSTLNELMNLPGIGDYCARAVLAFAFNVQVPVVDTNVARFLTRYFGLNRTKTENPARDRKLQEIAGALIPVYRARDFNLAILDLCAAHCSASQPVCGNCPLRKHCCYAQAPRSPEQANLKKAGTRSGPSIRA